MAVECWEDAASFVTVSLAAIMGTLFERTY
jgi:hypothetical protein